MHELVMKAFFVRCCWQCGIFSRMIIAYIFICKYLSVITSFKIKLSLKIYRNIEENLKNECNLVSFIARIQLNITVTA